MVKKRELLFLRRLNAPMWQMRVVYLLSELRKCRLDRAPREKRGVLSQPIAGGDRLRYLASLAPSLVGDGGCKATGRRAVEEKGLVERASEKAFPFVRLEGKFPRLRFPLPRASKRALIVALRILPPPSTSPPIRGDEERERESETRSRSQPTSHPLIGIGGDGDGGAGGGGAGGGGLGFPHV